jgi:U3 small nucleolar RNA-associated protein 25
MDGEEPIDDGSSDSDTENQQTGQPYNELLQLLHANTDSRGPARKKRKVDHQREKKSGAQDETPNAVAKVEDEALTAGNELQDQASSDEEDTPEMGVDGVDEDEDDEDGNYRAWCLCILADTQAANDPFDSHFTVSDEAEVSKKIQAAREGKWDSVKRELAEGLKLVRSIPDANEGSTPLLPAMKDTTNVKVGADCMPSIRSR